MPITRNIGGNLTPDVQLFGDWNKVRLFIHLLPELISKGSDKGQESAAKQLYRIVRRHIINNGSSLGWAPLSLDYQFKKAKSGFPPGRMYYASGTYYNNIKVWKKGGNTYVGIKARVKSGSSKQGLTLGQIARILEYGSSARNIPARPLWTPSFKDFGGTDRIKGFMTWHIRNEIMRRTGVKAQITF